MKKSLLILFVFLMHTLTAQESNISVEIIPPPPGELNLTSFNNAVIVSNDGTDAAWVYLKGNVTEERDGVVLEASSEVIEIPPGVTYLNEDNAGPLTASYNTNYRETLLRTGNAPAGFYTFCVRVIDAEMEYLLAEKCINIEIEKPSPPELISPVDVIEVNEVQPLFTWAPPMPVNASKEIQYRLIIAELDEVQTPEEAITSNVWHIEDGIMETSAAYPMGAMEMIPGNKYCWMVQAVDAAGNTVGQNDGKSEIFTFVYKTDEPAISPKLPETERSISLLNPVATCVGNVTYKVNDPNISFDWVTTGNFSHFNIILYENPCGQYPPGTPTDPPGLPPTTPGTPVTPPGKPTTPTTPVTPGNRPGTDAPVTPGGGTVTTGGGQTTTPVDGPDTDVPIDDTPPLPGSDIDDEDWGGSEGLPPLPPGWEWGSAGPRWTGETGPEPPALPPGWEWGPLRPVWAGEGDPPPRVILGMSEPIEAEMPFDNAESAIISHNFNIEEFIEPGEAFIYQVQGTTILDDGTTENILSDPQCIRYSPVGDDGETVADLECPKNTCRVESEMQLKQFSIDVYPTVMMRRLPDDPMPLKVLSFDKHCLVQKCFCTAQPWIKNHDLQANVRYEWEKLSGEGGFIKINEGTETKTEKGMNVLYNPPEIEDTITEKTIKIKVTAFHDDPTKAPDHKPFTAYLTMKIKREIKPKDDWKSTPHEFVDPGEVEDWYVYNFTLDKPDDIYEPCPEPQEDECLPQHTWKKGSKLDGGITAIPDEVCYGDYAKLEAWGSDDDKIDLVCVPVGEICTAPDSKTLKFNDYLEYEWSCDKGWFPRGAHGREVIWQAPDEEGEFEMTLTIRDAGGQYDDKDKTVKKKIKGNKLGIDLVKVDEDWLPYGANGRVPGYVKPMIYVCKDGKWMANGRKKIIYTKLKNLSREPGICMNYPPQPANLDANILLNRNPDMFFDEEENKDHWILMKDTSTTFKNPTKIVWDNDNPSHDHHYLYAVSKKRVTNIFPSIRVEDYGAYCKTLAKANHCEQIPPREKPGDPPCKKTNDCCTGDNTIKLPRDDNNNDIADGAQQDENGAPATKDEDSIPSFSPVKGDGLTNYQEYRGFVLSSSGKLRWHNRTPVNIMDVFIRNEKNLPLTYFRETNMMIREINEKELWQLGDLQIQLFASDPDYGTPANQLHPIEINYNRCKNEKHCPKTSEEDDWGEQHGIWLDEKNGMAGLYGICECDSPRFHNGEYFIIPKIVYKTLVNRQDILNIKQTINLGILGNVIIPRPKALEKTVAHELGHSVNVMHHGDKIDRFFSPEGRRLRIIGGKNRLVNAAGNPVKVYQVFARNGQTSGPENCVMLYDNFDGWFQNATTLLYDDTNNNGHRDPGEGLITFGGDRIYTNPIHKYDLPQRVGNTFCITKQPSGWNRSPNTGGAQTLPAGVEGNLDNQSDKNGCHQQIRVKSWKAL
ncbi:MAG: hypothetical protein K9H26_08460 [Prolixibacteraceae bacterium]|nr:hypothetical protein [Prolixibacteraceae bacterium]